MTAPINVAQLAIAGVVIVDDHQALRDLPPALTYAFSVDTTPGNGLKLWRFDSSSAVADDDDAVLAPNSGTGRWLMVMRIVGDAIALPENAYITWADGSLITSQGGVLYGQDTNTNGIATPLFPTNIQAGP